MNILNKELCNKIGIIGIIIYVFSLFISKAGVSIGLGFLTLAFLLYLWDRRKIELTIEEKYILIILILLPIFSLFSAGGTHSFQRALEKSYRYLPIFFIPLFIRSERVIKIVLSLFSLSIFISFINGIYFYKKLKWNFNARLISFSSHPLDEAHILAMGSLFLLAVIIYTIKSKKIKETVIYTVAFILAIIALILTQGRGAWLGFLGGIFVVVFLLMKNKKLFIVGVVLVGVLGLGAINSERLANNRYIKRFKSITNIKESSSGTRIFLWESSIDMFKDNFPFGVGRDNAGNHSIKYVVQNKRYSKINYQGSLRWIARTGNLHSLYFTSLAEEGILAIPFIGMFLFILYRQIRYCMSRERDLNFYLVVGTIGMLVAFLVGGLTENVWREIWKSNMLVFSLGLYLSRIKNKD